VSRLGQGQHMGRRMTKDERERKPLTLEDGQALREQCPAIKNVTVWISYWQSPHNVRFQNNTVSGIDFRGAEANYPNVYANAAMKEGRFFTEPENDHRQNVAVLGQNAASALFGDLPAVGHEVRIDGSTFRVIGVFEKPKGSFGMNDEDRRVVIPYWTFRKEYAQADENSIRFQADQALLDNAVDQAREVLRRRRNVAYNAPDNFEINTSQQDVDSFNQIVGMVVLATVVLSSVGLLIGGVGVMNIMLVSVTERTREIGVRKAIGAKRSNILMQFLIEAVTLSALGGVIGVIFGAGLTFLLKYAVHMPAEFSASWVFAALILCAMIGIGFGIYPAWKAARLDPVEALRYE